MKRSTFELGLRVINITRTMTGGLSFCSLGETARIKIRLTETKHFKS